MKKISLAMIILKFLERHDSLMKYSIILEPQEVGGFTARCLELPGAISQGETKTEAPENIKDAIRLILEVFREDLENLNYGQSEVLKVELADVF